MNILEVKAWKCGECGKAWLQQEFAIRCCEENNKKNKCRVCGCEVESPLMICFECRENERYEKAKKIKYSEYEGDCLWDERRDKYFWDKEELMEQYDNDACEDDKEVQFPTWCYGCIKIPFVIDIDYPLEHASEEMHEDFDLSDLVDLKELEEFVAKWNEKQTSHSFYMDYNTVILLDE